jgi:TRAP-type C4-dicarboxylate transport system, small permease component
MRVFSGFSKGLNWFGRILHTIGEYANVALLVIVVYSVFMRYVLNMPPIWVEEIGCYLFLVACALPLAETLRQDRHIQLDVLYNRFSAKGKNITNLITSIIALFWCAIISWKGIEYILQLYAHHTREATVLATPLWIPNMVFFLGSLSLP